MSKRDRPNDELNPDILEKSIIELLRNPRNHEEVLRNVTQLVAMKAAYLVKNVDSFPHRFDTPNPFLSLNYPNLMDCFRNAWDNTIGLARLKTPVEQEDRLRLDTPKEYSQDRANLKIFSKIVPSVGSNAFFTNADKIDELSLANFLINGGIAQNLSDYQTKFTYLRLKQRVTYIIGSLNVLIHLCAPPTTPSPQPLFLSKTPQLKNSAFTHSLADKMMHSGPLQKANGYAVLKLLPHKKILMIRKYQIDAYNELIDAILEFRYLSDVETSSVKFHRLLSLFVTLQKKIIGILKDVTGYEGYITFILDSMHFITGTVNYYKCFSMIRLISSNGTVSKTLIEFLCKSIFTLLTDAHVTRVVQFIHFLTTNPPPTRDEVAPLLRADKRVLYRLLTSIFSLPAKNVDELVNHIIPEEYTSEEESSDGLDGGRSNKSKKVRRYKKINTKRVRRYKKKINTKGVKRHIFRHGRSQCNKKK